jgi:RTX calcium-binding nonapeptide repeat (4 copies)
VGSGRRDILIGGAGLDRLRGGSDDDLLIGGTTAHDNNIAALLQILAEWTSTDDYATRTDKLRNGTGGLPKLDTTTVLDRGRHPVGNQGLDWFFTGLGDQLPDRLSAEQVN